MRANTVEQYYILKWLEANFHINCLKVSFIDRSNARIEDINGDEVIVTYIGKDNITLERVKTDAES